LKDIEKKFKRKIAGRKKRLEIFSINPYEIEMMLEEGSTL
jgi:hypothetical protein